MVRKHLGGTMSRRIKKEKVLICGRDHVRKEEQNGETMTEKSL